MEEYRGYFIERNFYGHGEYSVEYCGDDVIFRTLVEAKEFIDEITDDRLPDAVYQRSGDYSEQHI